MKDENLHINVTYDSCGRMNYHPDFHANHCQPWTNSDQQFLIDYYDELGEEKCSLALERTQHTISMRVHQLRKAGLMPMPERTRRHKHEFTPD